MFRLVWKTLFFSLFVGFVVLWAVDFLGLIQINPNQIWFILPPRHSCQVIIFKKKYCMLNMRSIPWGCKIMFLAKETFPSNKGCSCPSRAQLEFFERSVTYSERNGGLKGSLHFSKHCVICLKRQLIQCSFWWVKCFLQTNGVPSKQMAAGFFWKEGYMF